MSNQITGADLHAQDTSLLKDIEDALSNCMKCGNCMAVCPLYKEIGKESAVARGKLALMEGVLKGQLPYSEEFEKIMLTCLSCKACATKCPCGVPADELIIRGRRAAAKARGLSPIKKNVFNLLKHRQLFDFALRMAGLFGPLSFKKLPRPMAAVARFPMPGMDSRRITAPFAATPFRSQVPERITVANPKKKVGFFTGCTINYIYTDMGQSVVNVLKANDVEIVIPSTQHCCGTPVYVYGQTERTQAFAKHNIEVFEDAIKKYNLDAVIASCGSCAEALKIEYPHIFHDDPQMKARAEKLANMTYEISEFLVDVLPFRKDILGPVNETITMHDPCHMARGLKITKQPREILNAIPGLKFVEMSAPDRCCGSGGSFNLAHYDLARQVNDKKIADIASTKADNVATSCPSCRMFLTDGLVQNNQPQNCYHVIQLLDRSYQAGAKKA